MSALDAAIAALGRLVAYPTVSADSNLAMVADLAGQLEAAGARVEILPDGTGAKANLWATLGPEAEGGIVLSGHTDVVPADPAEWASDPFGMRRENGRLYGRGTCDMKGFIACCLAALPAFAAYAAEARRPVHFAFTHDEETSCFGGQALVRHLRASGLRPAMALIGEPTSLRIVDGHKGCCEYTVRFQGAEGHGSAPHRGVNAVEYAARYVARLLAHRAALAAAPPPGSPFDPPWTTINVGALHGGTVHNVIAGRAQLDWEMRPVAWDEALRVRDDLARFCAEELEPEMRQVSAAAGIETEIMGEVVGLEPRAANAMRDLVAGILGQNGTDVVAFGTEAGLFQGLGMDVIVCGPGSIAQAHKPDEYVEIAELARTLDMLTALAARL